MNSSKYACKRKHSNNDNNSNHDHYDINRELSYLHGYNKLLDDTNNALKNKVKKLKSESRYLKDDLYEKDDMIDDLKKQIRKKDILIDDFKTQVEKNDALIIDLEKQIKKKDSLIDSFKKDIDDLEKKNIDSSETDHITKQLHPKYKTKVCLRIAIHNKCSHGKKCVFIHPCKYGILCYDPECEYDHV